MKCAEKLMQLYAVTDRAWTGRQTLLEQTEAALRGGVTCVQLREKDLDTEAVLEEAIAMKSLCQRYQIPLIINDRVDVAIRCQADGIHVGQDDMQADDVRKRIGSQMILGVSAQTLEQARTAEQNGADYLGVGAVFPTTTKTDAQAVSLDTLRQICAAVSIPVCAIGGISAANLPRLAGTGIDGVAVVSAIFASPDIEASCRTLARLSQQTSAKNNFGGRP